MKKLRVFDCFCFFNELDLLELRLHTLAECVDYFVLVEATRTHQNQKKKLFFQDNKNRYQPFLDKIIHVVVDSYPGFWNKFRKPNAWDLEKHQKNAIAKGLQSCHPQDIILFSDVDEIPNPYCVIKNLGRNEILVFQQKHFYFYLNYLAVERDNTNDKKKYVWWYGTLMFPYYQLSTFSKMRRKRDFKKYKKVHVLKEAGWHFGYLGGVEKIIQKLEAFAHTEYNHPLYKNPIYIQQKIEQGQSLFQEYPFRLIKVPLDDSFPAYLLQNQHLFQQHLLL
ncbi:MAG: N-acetylglucosaminyltransferase [Bacteroidia bacterium]|nr:N-acetylglucosaminyltransferase [Bacteroidia bacterium]MDW8158398.1 N-acetylglucosaminyltransferase [Bacteroidia bacterium]